MAHEAFAPKDGENLGTPEKVIILGQPYRDLICKADGSSGVDEDDMLM
jgi:hypothetical protein